MTLHFSILVSLIPVGIALFILILGFYLWYKISKGLGGIIVLAGLSFGILFGPMLFMDRVELNEKEITQSTGLWFKQTVKGFEFKGISKVLITMEADLKNRPVEIWYAQYQSGKSIRIDPGDLWEINGDIIIDFMRKNGVDVIRE